MIFKPIKLLIQLIVIFCITFPLSSSLAQVETSANTNILQNPGFEMLNKYSEYLPADWVPDLWATGSDLVIDNTQAHEGIRSVSISQDTPSDARWLQQVAVKPNTEYRLSGWIKTQGVEHTKESEDAGANLCVFGTWTHTQAVFGTTDWTYVEMTFNSGAATKIVIGARLGFWNGTTTGKAWFDELRLESLIPPPQLNNHTFLPVISRIICQSNNPSWKIQILLYTSTDFQFTDRNGTPHHFVSSVTQAERIRIGYATNRFAMQDVPALNDCNMQPTVTVIDPGHPLTQLSPMGCNDYTPTPSDTAADRNPAFDSVITVWDGSGTDLLTGQDMTLQGCAWAWYMGTGQTYDSIPVDYVSYSQRNIFKHEWGHSILFYYDAAGTAPKPTVDNHINDTDKKYVNCATGEAYILQDETDFNPIPNSIYNNTQGFSHDYYSGQAATPDQPTRCLGLPNSAWATGGPVTRALFNWALRTWFNPRDDIIGAAIPDWVTYQASDLDMTGEKILYK